MISKLTTDDFVKISTKKHGNKFDYTLVDYQGVHKKVKIICNKHNLIFHQSPNLHMKSNICCPTCKNEYKSKNSPRRNSQEKFIELAIQKYGNKYDYSKVNYINNKTPVTIIFNDVEYSQRPDSHLQGKCPEREWKTTLSNKDFKDRAIKKHGSKYDYSESKYIDMITPLKIFCQNHSYFFQTPASHLRGSGCPKCSESEGESIIRTFLEYNNIRFQYQKTFDGCFNKNKLLFDFYLEDYNICIEFDGIQHSNPVDFFGGYDSFRKLKNNDSIKTKFCQNNNIELIRLTDKKTIEQILYNKFKSLKKISQSEKNKKFIEKSRKIWGYKYEYNKTKYLDSRTPVIITFNGVDYLQSPLKHLQKKCCELNNNTLSKEEFIRRCEIKWGDRFDYTNTFYKNSYSKITFYDRDKGIFVQQKASSHMAGNEYVYSVDNFIKISELVSDMRCSYDNLNYKRLTNNLTITCKLHGDYETRGYDHIKNRFGGSCKKCIEYKIFKEITLFLNKNKINFYTEHWFHRLPLPFDFYIPSMRTCIEFDSIQHFQPVEHFGGIKAYEQLKINDKIKTDYCEENYINLIRIKHTQLDDIHKILYDNLRNYIKK